LPMSPKDAIRLSKDLKFFGQSLKGSAKIMGDVALVTKSVKRLVGGSKSGDLSSKFITAGMACVVFPEPVFSDIVGWTLIATGALLKSRKGPTITDIFRETRKIMADIKKINF